MVIIISEEEMFEMMFEMMMKEIVEEIVNDIMNILNYIDMLFSGFDYDDFENVIDEFDEIMFFDGGEF